MNVKTQVRRKLASTPNIVLNVSTSRAFCSKRSGNHGITTFVTQQSWNDNWSSSSNASCLSRRNKRPTQTQGHRKFHVSTRYCQDIPTSAAGSADNAVEAHSHELSPLQDASGGKKPVAPFIDFQDQRLPINELLLRDNCRCSECVDPSTQQKLFKSTDIPTGISARNTRTEADHLVTQWTNDIPGWSPSHESRVPIHLFTEPRNSQYDISNADRVLWNRAKMETSMMWLEYEDWLRSDRTVLQGLRQLHRYGLLFLRSVPESDQAVEKIAKRIGPLRDSFYGRTWDVRSVPDAKNVAYTAQYLGLHMDLLYMANPPFLQLLHCLKNSAAGGASIFSDAIHAVAKMDTFLLTARRTKTTTAFKALARHPLPYHYRNNGQYYWQERPLVDCRTSIADPHLESFLHSVPQNSIANVQYVNYSPPFQAPRSSALADASTFRLHTEMSRFVKHLEDPKNVYEYKMQEGDCVIFNNRRVVHGRQAFDPREGERWFKGCYVDEDAYSSRLRVLRQQFESDVARPNELSPQFYARKVTSQRAEAMSRTITRLLHSEEASPEQSEPASASTPAKGEHQSAPLPTDAIALKGDHVA